MKAAWWLVALLGACAGADPPEVWQVELIEDEKVKLQQPATRALKVVPRFSLPLGLREGDLLIQGEIDAAATARGRRAVHEARERAFKRAGAGVGRNLPAALTPDRKR